MPDVTLSTPKARRGRPPARGVKPGWMLWRAMEVLRVFDQHRAAGEKHDQAIENTVKALRRSHARMAISSTEVKRVLRMMRPVGLPIEWAVRQTVLKDGRVEFGLYVRDRSPECRVHLQARQKGLQCHLT